MRTKLLLPALAFLLPVAITSCTATLDLERFKKAEQASTNTTTPGLEYYDFKFIGTSFASHTNEYLEFRLIDKANQVRAKMIYDGITQVAFNLYAKRWIPTDTANAPYRIDFWSDHNLSRKYDGIVGDVATKDHAWRRVLQTPLPKDVVLKGDRYEFSYVHDTAFVDITTDLAGQKIPGDTTAGNGLYGDAALLPFEAKVIGAGTTGHIGKKIEIRVYEKSSSRLVGMHRRGRAADPYTAQIFGVLDQQTDYTVQAYVDLDEDGLYNPATEQAWSIPVTSNQAGVNMELKIAELPLVQIETGDLTTPTKL